MTKGFHNFTNNDDEPSNEKSNNEQMHNNNNNKMSNTTQNGASLKIPPSGFSSCINSSSNSNLPKSTQNNQNSTLRDISHNRMIPNSNIFNENSQNEFQGYSIFEDTNQNPYSNLLSQFGGGSVSDLSLDSSASEAMIMALFQIIESQAKSLQKLFQKVEIMTLKINEFNQKMVQVKKNKIQSNYEPQKPLSSLSLNQNVQNIDSSSLIKILFGSNKTYDFKLELAKNMDLPLYRERNFQIQLKLVSLDGKIVDNHNKIPLSLALYSSQNPPKFIQKNTTGQKILKGFVEQSLHHGYCRFEKIQIREVTSHFRNGWVFIVVIPCMTPLGSANPNHKFIDYVKIEPLVLQKIVVKAKKIKEKTNEKSKQNNAEDKEDSEQVQNKSSFMNGGSKQLDIEEQSVSKRENKKIQQNSQQIFDQK